MSEKEYIERKNAQRIIELATGDGWETEYAVDRLNEIPAADVRPVVEGHWIYKKRFRGGFNRVTGIDDEGNEITITVDNRREVDEPYCSECGKWNDGSNMEFCGVCGADMREPSGGASAGGEATSCGPT